MPATELAADQPIHGRLNIFVAFDWGDEIDLEQASRLIGGEPHVLRRRRRTPSSIEYLPPPLRLALPAPALDFAALRDAAATAELTIFDFAAVSVRVRLPLCATRAQLAELAGELADPGPLVATARGLVESVFERLRPAIKDAQLSTASEEYFVFELSPAPPLPAIDQLLVGEADWLAGLVRLEAGPLSADEVREALRLQLRYAPSDLFVPDWSAAVLVDEDCDETLEAIEFANLQLLEFRYTDQQLDVRLAEAYRLIHPLARSWLPFWRSLSRPLRELGDLRIEAHAVSDRASNVLKLIGDQYLARVYRLVAARFHLDQWEQSIRRSLDVVEEVYRTLSDQTATWRAEFLEVVIVLLIAFEIVMAFWRG
ncbi:MAG: hypothetical protein K2Y37_08200 [Pirellulales bacterium]|nr:hypothetical protein [Pirellulales bacterium]